MVDHRQGHHSVNHRGYFLPAVVVPLSGYRLVPAVCTKLTPHVYLQGNTG